MEALGGIARQVRIEEEAFRDSQGIRRSFKKVTLLVESKKIELTMLPLADIEEGDEVVVVGEKAQFSSVFAGIAYDNRTKETHGRYPRKPFLHYSLVCFGAIALMTPLLVYAKGPIGLLSLPIILLLWLPSFIWERTRRQALNTAFTTDISKRVEAERTEEARKQAEKRAAEKKRQDEIDRRNKLLPIERAIEDLHGELGHSGFPMGVLPKIESLAVPNDPLVFKALIALLDNPAVGKRALAAYALGKIRNPLAIPVLLKVYDGPAPKDFEVMYMADADDTDYTVQPISGTVLLDSERYWRDLAAIYCGHPFKQISRKFSDNTLQDFLKEGFLDRATAVEAFLPMLRVQVEGKFNHYSQKRIVEQIDKLDPNWAASAAAREVVPDLLPLLELQYFDQRELVFSTAKILARIGDPRALPTLRARLNDRPELASIIAEIEAKNL